MVRQGKAFLRFLCLSLLPLACLAGLLAPAPVSALAPTARTAEPTAAEPTDRGRVLTFWKVGGPGVRAAAEVALSGTDAEVDRFLAEVASTAHQDDRVAAANIAGIGGPNTIEAARAALAGSQERLRTFLDFGWREPFEQDERVRVSQVIDAGARMSRSAAEPRSTAHTLP
ncbi:ALF repeat-containing protein [Streptomyces anulatus]